MIKKKALKRINLYSLLIISLLLAFYFTIVATGGWTQLFFNYGR